MISARQSATEALETALLLYRSGDLGAAESMCRLLLQPNAADGDLLHMLGLVRLAAGDSESALDFLQQAAQAAPANPFCHYNLGEAYHSLGLLSESAKCYEKAIDLRPDFTEARNNLGIVLHEQGFFNAAINSYEQALTTASDSTRVLMNLGNILIEAGRAHDAMNCFERVILLDGQSAEAYHWFCRAASAMERPEEELKRLTQAIGACPDASGRLNMLAEALQELDRADVGLGIYDLALLIDPYCGRTHQARGLLLESLGRVDEAYSSLKRAVQLEQDNGAAHDDLGRLCYEQGHFDEAKSLFQAAVDKGGTFAMAHAHLGAMLAQEGLLEAAAAQYEKAHSLNPHAGYRVILATLAPVIPLSAEEIGSARSAMEHKIDEMLTQGLSIGDPYRDVGKANFYLAYQGLDDRDIQVKLARFYERICPSLDFAAPHCRGRHERSGSGKIRIGFLSKHLRNHTIGNYMRGVIANIDRSIFDVRLFLFAHKKDEISAFLEEHADGVTLLPETLFLARRAVAAKELDILFYPDIGMDPFTYFLAFSRLAPVQCAFYGHPITTGIKTVDYFISHADCEVADGEAHYSEKLVRLSEGVTYAYYPRPPAPAIKKGRRDFTLADSDHIYLCAQSLFKIHPHFDPMLLEILSRDAEAIIVFFEGEHATWTDLLKKRLEGRLGEEACRIRFVGRQQYEDYLNLVAMADVILDTPYFNGGATTFDALAMGKPIVTLPNDYMRGRQTYALYRRMGVMDCVAGSPGEYIEKAVRLGTDATYRAEIERKISANSYRIFEDMGMVRELEAHLREMVQCRGR